MRVLLAPASFKGFLLAHAAARAMEEAISPLGVEIVRRPLADGGEGTLASLREARGGRLISVETENPWGRSVHGRILHWPRRDAAFVELAQASGWATARRSEWHVGTASTYGVGLLVKRALDLGVEHLTVTLGGSLTNDAGAGLLEALGARLMDASGQVLPRGGLALKDLARLDLSGLDPRLKEVRLEGLADVDNPLLGPEGSSRVFARQKGANLALIDRLEEALSRFHEAAEQVVPGLNGPHTGAAGGTGAALLLMGAHLRPGGRAIMRIIGFESALRTADLLITGEGRFDRQSLHGKAPAQALERAQRLGKPAVLIVGKPDEEGGPFPFPARVLPVAPVTVPVATVRREIRKYIGERAAEAVSAFLANPTAYLPFTPPPKSSASEEHAVPGGLGAFLP